MENPIRIGRAKSRGVARSPLLAGTRVPLFTLRTSAEQMSYGSHLVLHFLITVTYGKNHKDTKKGRIKESFIAAFLCVFVVLAIRHRICE